MNALLNIEKISKSFDGIDAVVDFSLMINKGLIVGLIGPNGAGKTTLFNIITGFLKPDFGDIKYQEFLLNGMIPFKIARLGIARTFQDLRLIKNLTVLENILLSYPDQNGEDFFPNVFKKKNWQNEEIRNVEKANNILEFVDLLQEKNHLANNISYGQQKLLSLASCIATEADLLLLDEPVSGVHPELILKITLLLRQLANLKKTIFFIEHNIDFVRQISDQVVVMDHGAKIASGSPELVLNDKKILEAYLD